MRNSGKWTEARFTSFVKGILRAGSNKWPPKWEVRTRSRQSRGIYLCKGHGRKPHAVAASIRIGSKRHNNVFVDHIKAIVGRSGFSSWDDFINNLYCEVDNLQVLCKACHDLKTKEEKEGRKNYERTK